MQSYHDYASFCPAKHDVYSVLSTEGGLNVNIGHIVYMGLCLNYETYSFYIAPCNGLLGPLAQYAANHVVGIYKKNNVPEFPT